MPLDCMIRRLDIRNGMYSKTFFFTDGFNLIQSNGRNSVGKTTLIRAIFYALGEPITNTVKFKFPKHAFRIEVQQGDKTIIGIRERDSYRIRLGDDRFSCYVLPYELNDVRKAIWGFGSEQVAENYLAGMFIDQDEGWTLLNRGKVSCGIGFNIELLIDGLSGDRVLDLTQAIKGLDDRIERYKTVSSIAGLKEELNDSQIGEQAAPNLPEAAEALSRLRVERNALQRRANSVKKAISENERFAAYIENLGLRITVSPGVEIAVTKENLAGFEDSVGYQIAELSAMLASIKAKDAEISDLENKIEGDSVLFSVAESIDDAERQIAQLNIRKDAFEKAVDSLKEERSDKKRQRSELLANGNEVADFLAETIAGYCEQLGIESDYYSDSKGIFTNKLKDKSGTRRLLLVLAFRLGYAKAIERYCGIRLPFIVDSPRSGEIDEDNFRRMMSLIQRELHGWQIVVASIGEVGVEPASCIVIKEKMLEDSCMVDDIGQWEHGAFA